MSTSPSNLEPAAIEAIVREVLARLSGKEPAHASGDGVLVIAGKLVTVDQLPAKLKGVQKIVAAPSAVVTPAVRDLLKEQGIELIRRAVTPSTKSSAAIESKRVFLGVAETSLDPTGLIASLGRDVAIQQVARAGLVDVIADLCGQIGLGGEKGILLTDESDVAICLANRQRGVRAVLATGVDQIRRACSKWNANLLVIAPGEQTSFGALRLAKTFVHAKGNMDDRYRERLGQ